MGDLKCLEVEPAAGGRKVLGLRAVAASGIDVLDQLFVPDLRCSPTSTARRHACRRSPGRRASRRRSWDTAAGKGLRAPGMVALMSLTSTVPCLVPSDSQSSSPLRAVLAVEEERPAEVGVVGGVDSLDELRPGLRPVRLPEPVIAAVVQLEEQRASFVEEIVGVRAVGAVVYVLGQDPGSCLRPVGGPQLLTVVVVCRREEERAAGVGELLGINVLDELRTALGPIPTSRAQVQSW